MVDARSLPITISGAAARDHADRCRDEIVAWGGGDSLDVVRWEASRLVALSHLHSVSTHPAPLIASVRALSEMAERLDDEVARGYALIAWGFAHPAPEHAGARARIANEVLDIAARTSENALVSPAYALLLVALLEMGDIRALDIEVLESRVVRDGALAADPASPAAWFHCLRSILDGDATGAERQAEELYANAAENGTEALALYTVQLGLIRWMQGRTDGVEEALLRARREYPEDALWTVALAWLWLLQGRHAASESLLRSAPDLDEIPRDRYWLATVAVLAEIAIATRSLEEMRRLHRLLLPFADHLIAVGAGVAFGGTVALTLGLLAEGLGMLTEARSHLELAADASMRVCALAWHAQAQIELASFALRHDIVDIPAHEILAEARATCEARGFTALGRKALPPPQVRVLGMFDVISICGRRAQWTSRKARELLKRLVAARGTALSREILMDALWPGEPPTRLGNRFSVAVNVVRRTLDPERITHTQRYVVTEGDSVRLDTDNVDVDLEHFLTLAARADDASRSAALMIYRGEAFSDEPYADWAAGVRDEAAHAYRMLS